MARWTEYHGLESFGTTSTTLPGAPDGVAAFKWRRDDVVVDEEGEWTEEPFYSWDEEEEHA